MFVMVMASDSEEPLLPQNINIRYLFQAELPIVKKTMK